MQYDPKKLIYIDEAGIDNNESYPYGWSTQGQRCFAKKSGKRSDRMNFIAGLSNEKLVTPFTFRGYCDRPMFEAYVQHCLLPVLSEGSIVIADNAAFHKSLHAKNLIATKGAKLVFLPPYSPDLNPIEHWWFPIKNEIRKALDSGKSLDKATTRAFNRPLA